MNTNLSHALLKGEGQTVVARKPFVEKQRNPPRHQTMRVCLEMQQARKRRLIGAGAGKITKGQKVADWDEDGRQEREEAKALGSLIECPVCGFASEKGNGHVDDKCTIYAMGYVRDFPIHPRLSDYDTVELEEELLKREESAWRHTGRN